MIFSARLALFVLGSCLSLYSHLSSSVLLRVIVTIKSSLVIFLWYPYFLVSRLGQCPFVCIVRLTFGFRFVTLETLPTRVLNLLGC